MIRSYNIAIMLLSFLHTVIYAFYYTRLYGLMCIFSSKGTANGIGNREYLYITGREERNILISHCASLQYLKKF